MIFIKQIKYQCIVLSLKRIPETSILMEMKARWNELGKIKVILGNKYFTPAVVEKVKGLSDSDQQRFLDVMMEGLSNDDSFVEVYANRPEDYDVFSFYQNHSLQNRGLKIIRTSQSENMFLQKQIQNQKKLLKDGIYNHIWIKMRKLNLRIRWWKYLAVLEFKESITVQLQVI